VSKDLHNVYSFLEDKDNNPPPPQIVNNKTNNPQKRGLMKKRW